MESHGYYPLFETKRAKGQVIYRLFSATIFVGICLIWVYRLSHVPRYGEGGRWAWMGMFGSDLWFGLYWLLTQALRWNRTYRHTFKERLSQRFEKDLPGTDVFVCTADPEIEPPMMVANTVLSAMAYDYPSEKLSVYVSDDAGSDLTFYAILEVSNFAKHWIPFCKKFKVEPRSPAAYFNSTGNDDSNEDKDLLHIKKLYLDMENRIINVVKQGQISEELHLKYEGFSSWDSYSSKRDHDSIIQILINRKDPNAKDMDGMVLPALVYMAREKRPHYHHNFKAGAMNSLLRVSSEISKGDIILNIDCDMYSNNSQSLRDAICFFLDEKKGYEVAFVQFPQSFENITKNDIYGNYLRECEVEFHGLDGVGGPLYVGTGCFHRRDLLHGRKTNISINHKNARLSENDQMIASAGQQELLKHLASCNFEKGTNWGKEMGLLYGYPVEDVVTGLHIQSQGWKSVFYNPPRKAFLGVAPTTLPDVLVQHKRWSEGDFQILLSKFSPAWHAYGKISIGLQMGYCRYCLWAPNCLATVYYSVIPSLYLLKGISFFPQVSSPWFIPFAYVVFATNTYSLFEFLCTGGTILGWWNDQRIWLYKRTSSYLFAFIDTMLKLAGYSDLTFIITAKVVDPDVSQRYEEDIMEFGVSSPLFTSLTTLGFLNLLCFASVAKESLVSIRVGGVKAYYERMCLQVVLCVVLVLINLPLYQAVLLRKDKGKLPTTVAMKSVGVALIACLFTLLY